MLNVMYSVLEDSLRPVDTTVQIYSGSPVTLETSSATGKITTVTSNVVTYGLAKFDANSYANFALSTDGSYGGGQMTVVKQGIVQLFPSVYQDPTTLNTTVVQMWVTTDNFLSGDPLYVNGSNKITKDGTSVGNTVLGKIIIPPSATNGGVMVIQLSC